jgi:hypothetical protein
MKAALGLRVHSGWAAAVVVAGSPGKPVLLERRRLVLADPDALPGSKQPFHAAEPLEFADAERHVARCVADARGRADEELRSLLRAASAAGHELVGCGMLLSSERALPELSRILAAHPLIHTAEGAHFRDALAFAARALSLKVLGVPERDVESRAAAAARVSPNALRDRVAALGKTLGPPWTQDQKFATMAALVAFASRS